MRRLTLFSILILISLAVVACGGNGGSSDASESTALVGDATRGEELYKQSLMGDTSAPGCATCHSLVEDVVFVGPSHAGVGTRAETAVEGMTAAEYLEQSIREPDAVIHEGFTAGVMYQNYDSDLTDQQIADLVAFLLTLK
jgi:cytochrome c553